jgi:hypothetical protein
MKSATAGGNDRILYGVLGLFVLGACLYMYEEVFAGSSASPAPTTAVVNTPAQPVKTVAASGTTGGTAAKAIATTSAGLDPTLHMEAMLVSEHVEYSGSGRSIFSASSAPPKIDIPTPVKGARLDKQVAQQVLPPPPPATCPPQCPPIDLKFFGVASVNGARRALLLHSDTVYVASAGEIVLRRYRVIAVDAKSIEVEDMQNNNKQTLPLLVN